MVNIHKTQNTVNILLYYVEKMCENEHTAYKYMHLSLFYNKDDKKGRKCCT